MLIKVFLLLSAAPLLTAGRVPQLEERIFLGEDTTIEENPWQVAIVWNGGHHCGGSIYSKDFIITAAHCIDDVEANQLQVRVGSSCRDEGGTLHQVAAFKWHSGFSRNLCENDIAIIRLSESLKFNDRVQSIPLATEEPEAGTKAKVTGWGTTLKGRGHGILQGLEVSIISRGLCQKLKSFVTDDVICAGALFNSLGGGDSGGPLTVNNELVGVVSSGRPFLTGEYVSVVYMKDWIQSTTESLSE
ncbi:LOW QUALITY PROTEIN: trypsin alpha-like [Drosophila subobscura]|uniref:LOW QUALITY PROTEIN: trypsin alpha-like n=1 Tax=Drosophila subobscura TaxID=7241 RepID=UPI00155A1A9E|nr:LOW QUALITY PROTEIN: trypsin alpha-like [Drosophila subobscura]